jgi:hypothetical protein
MDLAALLARAGHGDLPFRRARYDLDQAAKDRLAEQLAPSVARWVASRG